MYACTSHQTHSQQMVIGHSADQICYSLDNMHWPSNEHWVKIYMELPRDRYHAIGHAPQRGSYPSLAVKY